jgi:two-component system, cell cycle response regulator
VLRKTAQRIASTLRVSDVIARWGGEEFCVFFPDTGTEGAITALRKASNAVRALQFETPQGAFGITFSAGVALVKDPASIESALAEADRFLYVAKAAGRNRVLSADDAKNPPQPTILFVEDDDGVAGMVTTLLNRRGFDVTRFSNGDTALENLGKQDFVLALLDVNLPGADGFDLVAAIRKTKNLAKIPIVMLTGSDDENDVMRSFDLGVNDYVTKPFYPAELLARIERALAR